MMEVQNLVTSFKYFEEEIVDASLDFRSLSNDHDDLGRKGSGYSFGVVIGF